MLAQFIGPSLVPWILGVFDRYPSENPHKDSIFLIKLQKSQFCTISQRPRLPTLQVFSAKRFLDVQRHHQQYSVVCTNPIRNGHTVSRISRVNWADAQNALFEYLHVTRGLHYTDAEHLSQNSPVFIQNLLSKIDKDEDVGRSVARFLRYHPVNEFEPFFESLGLKHSELQPLLPKNLIYLSDDDVLFDNYQVLCNYGVPRSKIGKMYKEGMAMFRYDFGVLFLKLHAYEKLGLSKPTIIKLVTCCPALLVGDVNVDFLKVLEKLKSFGVELDWIRASLSDKSRYDWNQIHDMLHLLDGLQCNKKDLCMFIKDHPRFAFNESGKEIYILVAVLLKLGLRREDIMLFFQQYSRILTGNFIKNLWRSIQFLSEIGMEAKDTSNIVSKHARVLGSSACLQPKVVLKNLNLSAKKLCEAIVKDPSQFNVLTTMRKSGLRSQPKIEGTFLKEKTVFLLKIGFVENSDEMAKALSKFRGRGDQLQERFDCLVNAGLDCHRVSEMIRLVPSILNQSTKVIEKKLDYFLNQLGYPVESVVASPTCLCNNLEKIKLRFSMYKWLKENGEGIAAKKRKMVTSTMSLRTLTCSDARFAKYVVSLHPEGPKVWERLKNSPSDQ